MARPLRIEFEGALYHVTLYSNRREAIYEDDDDRQQFLARPITQKLVGRAKSLF